MHSSFENQRVLSFKITNQVWLCSYLSDLTRTVLRVYMVEKLRENENQNVEEEEEEKEDFFDDRLDDLDMNIPDYDQIPTLIDATNMMCNSSQSTQSGNLQDDGTDFSYWNHHTCGSEHILGQNPHATTKVLSEYFRGSFPDGKGPSTRLMSNQLITDLGVLVSYWKVYTDMGIAKDLVRGILEHGYEVLDDYHYMIESTNPESKKALHLDENGRFKYFFVSYGAWIQGFRHLRKGIAVDGTFLRSKYNGVLLAVVAQDAENHIFPVAFYVADKECDASYGFFLNNCDIASKIPKSCVLHLGVNIRNNYHNESVVTFFYRAAKAYSREEFLDHFNQIEYVNPKVVGFLERVGFERWSRAFSPANRYNIMTSNIAEFVNSLFGDEKEVPIKAMFEKISEKYSDFFNERRVQFKCPEKRIRFVLKIEKKISTNISMGNRLFSHKIADYKFYITGHGDAATIDLQTRSYMCRVFYLDKIPCPHAMAALRAQYDHKYGPEVYEHSFQYYSVKKYEMAYSGRITLVPPEESWVVPVELMGRLIPPPYINPCTIKSGRKPYKRRRGVGESFSSRRNKCSICKCAGQKRTTCPNHNPP
ncbi:hypothetical protein P3S68_033838 [Capsicum galapagoense]